MKIPVAAKHKPDSNKEDSYGLAREKPCFQASHPEHSQVPRPSTSQHTVTEQGGKGPFLTAGGDG